MKKFFCFFFSLICACPLFSQEKISCSERKGFLQSKISASSISALNISDTIHIRNYEIHIDTINFSAKTIRANTKLTVQSKQNGINNITLWLLKLQVDSIQSGNQNLSYTYNDTLLRIIPPFSLNTNDSIVISVFYRGAPQKDASGWGGFYFNGNFAFNLGVGFDANPHVFGRVWFPCIDEFTDHSTYEFFITTDSSKKAFCNGILQNETDNGNGTKIWHWKMNQPIPTYLASVAVAPFYTMHRNYSGIPVEFAILADDSIKTINTYENLDSCISAYLDYWGNYPFDKIGYVVTPEVYGGMEHASSIHLSRDFVNGSKAYETLWAHELAHMWWGDNVTSDKEEEMWLIEGWATFNEHLFTEAIYGNDAYRNSFRSEHRKVLQFSHVKDGNYWAMNNVPHAYTYATLSVYSKGAQFAHTLRNYMGDENFFAACKYYQNKHAYGNANSYEMRDDFTFSSGMDMSGFFEGWIFTPGFPHFTIDSSKIIQSGNNFEVSVFTKQKQKGNSHLYNMKVECNFTDGVNDTDIVFLIDNTNNVFTANLPFNPLWISVDRNEKMMDAVTDYEKMISSNGTNAFPETNVSLNVQDTGSGKSIVRIEHNWVAPDDFKNNPGIRLSDYHYWKADGIFASGFYSKATFTYDGTTSLSTGYLDNTLITDTSDTLVILHRAGAYDDWKIVNGYKHNKLNRKGNFVIDTLKKGEYTIGKYDYTILGNPFQIVNTEFQFFIYPNPAADVCRIVFSQLSQTMKLVIHDVSGKKIYSTPVFPHQQFINWDTYNIPSGVYSVSVFADEKIIKSEKLIIAK